MSDTTTLTAEEKANILSKLGKLLQTKGTTEAEAESRTAKAMELLAKYNLSMDDVMREADGTGKRAEEKLKGGFYQFERDLWTAVAELNFCWYLRWWTHERTDKPRKYKVNDPNSYDYDEYRYAYGSKKVYQHRIIGRQVNIAGTKAMATYLIQTTQRLTLERLHGDNSQMLSRWAISYKEGIVARVCEKLYDRRRQVLSEEREKQRAAEKMAMAGASTETALSLATHTQREREANYDFVMGEGWSARAAADRAERAMLDRMSQEDYTAWAAANPEKAAARAEEERNARRSRSRGGGASQERQRDWGAFRAGYEAGEKVGIDPQAEGHKPKGYL